MKLYLDTNIVVYMLENKGQIDSDINEKLVDYANALFTGSVCVQEMIYLRQRNKIFIGKDKDNSGRRHTDIVDMVEELGINIIPVSSKHLKKLEELPLIGEHRDHNDRVIIAQAISDKATIVSSDSAFTSYEKYGLDVMFNKK